MIQPLAILQARMASSRLPGKMLLDLGARPLVWWAWKAAVDAFGRDNVVCALPVGPANNPLADAIANFGGTVYWWSGPENDVLGRFYSCAHTYRWHPDSTIVRVTADDPFKSPQVMRRVAQGERHPVELGAEAFTLSQLDAACLIWPWPYAALAREHITHAIFPGSPPPPAPPGIWTVDTAEDLADARAVLNARGYEGVRA